jgi:hypothetical protein
MRQVSYLGFNPSEESSGGRQRLGSISKQGNSMVRHLVVEAGQAASKLDPKLRRDYERLGYRRGNSGVAKVAIARKCSAVVLEAGRSSPAEHRPSHAGQPGKSCGGRKSVGKMIGCPASPGSRKGSSKEKSWSEVEDRIHGWWS